MKALFLILFVFSTFMLLLGYSARNTENAPLGNALIVGGLLIYFGMFATWLLFKTKQKGEGER